MSGRANIPTASFIPPIPPPNPRGLNRRIDNISPIYTRGQKESYMTITVENYHRYNQRKDGCSTRYNFLKKSGIKRLSLPHTTSPGNAGRGRFRGCFEPFDENSKITRVPLGLAPPKSGLTRFLTEILKFNCRKETTNV